MKTFLFYDLETTGLNKAFDQVLQFAAIRTDHNLQEIERTELTVRLRPDVIPHPRALITHHIGIHDTENGLSEYEAMQQIHALLNTPGTISLGYNTLDFDDEFLRFSFYRNLLSPYTHQYANQCGRMDLYPITVLYYLYNNAVLQWPTVEDRLSLKLEELNRVNHWHTGRAHDAMVDVEVTLALARVLQEETAMWTYCCGYFDKATDHDRVAKLPDKRGLYCVGRLGAAHDFQAPVLGLGEHRHYRNQTLWLRLDQTLFSTIPEADLIEQITVYRKKYGEPGMLLPWIERFNRLTQTRTEQAEMNQQWLAAHPEVLQALREYYLDYTYPEIPNLDVDAALYQNGFPSPYDQAQAADFHAVDWSEKASVMEGFEDPLYRELARRILARHDATVHEPSPPTVDYRGEPRLGKAAALAEIVEIRGEVVLSAEQEGLLAELESYLRM